MTEIPLQQLGLQEKWPRLAELYSEVASLTKELAKADAQVSQRRAELEAARASDLNAAATAVRSGKATPKPGEPQAQRKLETAERERVVLQKALGSAQGDVATFQQKHGPAIFADVSNARQELAEEAARGARTALAAYGQWYELRYLLKNLQPAPVQQESNAPAQNTTYVIGARVSSMEPDRGYIEGPLRYLIGLAEHQEKTNAA